MRMWMVDPSIMCKNHLLGEHREIHMCVGYLHKGNHLNNYAFHGLIEAQSLQTRHDTIVKEMQQRGYSHRGNLFIDENTFKHLHSEEYNICINPHHSLNVLLGRCEKCRSLYLSKIGIAHLHDKEDQTKYQENDVQDNSNLSKIISTIRVISQL